MESATLGCGWLNGCDRGGRFQSVFERVLLVMDEEALRHHDAQLGVVRWVRRLLRSTKGQVSFLVVGKPARGITMAGRTLAFGHQIEDGRRAEALARLGGVVRVLRAEGLSARVEVGFGVMSDMALQAVGREQPDLVAVTVEDGSQDSARPGLLDLVSRAPVPVLVARRRQRAA